MKTELSSIAQSHAPTFAFFKELAVQSMELALALADNMEPIVPKLELILATLPLG
jgi:hypothetical protein